MGIAPAVPSGRTWLVHFSPVHSPCYTRCIVAVVILTLAQRTVDPEAQLIVAPLRPAVDGFHEIVVGANALPTARVRAQLHQEAVVHSAVSTRACPAAPCIAAEHSARLTVCADDEGLVECVASIVESASCVCSISWMDERAVAPVTNKSEA